MSDCHILIVDDDILGSQALKDHFEGRGYQVTLAGGCQEAKDILAGSPKVNLIILDYLMPDGLGTDLLRSIAQDTALQKPQVIMSSSFIDPENPDWQALRNRLPPGAKSLICAYVNKPFTFERMDNEVTLLLNSSEASSSKERLSGDYRSPSQRAPDPADLKVRRSA